MDAITNTGVQNLKNLYPAEKGAIITVKLKYLFKNKRWKVFMRCIGTCCVCPFENCMGRPTNNNIKRKYLE